LPAATDQGVAVAPSLHQSPLQSGWASVQGRCAAKGPRGRPFRQCGRRIERIILWWLWLLRWWWWWRRARWALGGWESSTHNSRATKSFLLCCLPGSIWRKWNLPAATLSEWPVEQSSVHPKQRLPGKTKRARQGPQGRKLSGASGPRVSENEEADEAHPRRRACQRRPTAAEQPHQSAYPGGDHGALMSAAHGRPGSLDGLRASLEVLLSSIYIVEGGRSKEKGK